VAAGAVFAAGDSGGDLAVAGLAAGLLQSAIWQRALNLELSRLLKAVAENPAAGFRCWRSVLSTACCMPGAGAWQDCDYHLAGHPSGEAEIQHYADAGRLAPAGAGGDCAGGGGVNAAAAAGRQLHLSSFWLEKGSYLLVGALGLLLCWRALKKLRARCGDQHLPLYAASRSSCPVRLRASASAGAGTAPKRR
jgi:hypothetical protein